MTIAGTLGFLRSNNLLNSATKEIVGSNIPHMLLVQNTNEAVDQAISQFGNTIAVFGGTLGIQRLINRLFARLNPQGFDRLSHQFKDATAQQWFSLGKATAIYSFVGAYVNASPFLRNWISLQRTHKLNYADMVGVTGNTTEDDAAKVKQQLKDYRKTFTHRIGLGLMAMGVALAGTQAMLHHKVPVPKALQALNRHLVPPRGDFTQLKDLPTYLFWVLPTYLGMWQGSRDQLEKVEVLYRAAGFGLAFLILPRTLEKLTAHLLKENYAPKIERLLGPRENAAFLVQLISGILFYASIPTVINLIKRKGRAQEMGLMPATGQPTAPHPAFQYAASRANPFRRFQDQLITQ